MKRLRDAERKIEGEKKLKKKILFMPKCLCVYGQER